MLKLFVWLFGKHHLFLLKAPSKFRYNSAFCFLKALSDVFIQRAEDRRRQQANQRPVSRSCDHSGPISRRHQARAQVQLYLSLTLISLNPHLKATPDKHYSRVRNATKYKRLMMESNLELQLELEVIE